MSPLPLLQPPQRPQLPNPHQAPALPTSQTASNAPYGANNQEEVAEEEVAEEEVAGEEEAVEDHRLHLTSMYLNNPPNQFKM